LRRAVDFAYQAGASAIVAHGTHVIGPLERREHGIIAWGLGNVAFSCQCMTEDDAILLRVSIQTGQQVRAEVFPIRAGINGAPAGRSKDSPGIFKLLEAIGSSQLQRHGDSASF
jgi:poly-gamma-glutamate capsule biosynthesis protein CapA/YwtB (metallophosphatase superfamily)